MKRIRIKIEDHQIIAGKRNLNMSILSHKDGEYAVEIKKWRGNKTLQQIRAVKGVIIPEYAKFTGQTKKEAQRYLKEEYGVTDRFADSQGRPCIEFKSFRYYSKDEMRTFIQGTLDHLEYDCNFIIDLELRKRLRIDEETGELVELNNIPQKPTYCASHFDR